ncbi:hypothetical protein IB267_17110 [Ensifer sp. ENS09]|uniref:hypothetical protein n=1 Tax=Ensifer sp. ENS09 TaxID=2769263 RepID=UPI00177DF547|nr:hypothetical protein [Ensifer sp. ENS09]MBD9650076.1 hypothetical protein [Ensifer sp. ENS09]
MSEHPSHGAPSEWDPALDAVTAAPENHLVLHEDEFIRVLSVTLAPGETGKVHHHRFPSVIIMDRAAQTSDFDGLTGEEIHPSGSGHSADELPFIVVMPPQPLHYVRNRDDKVAHGIRIEFKQGLPKR